MARYSIIVKGDGMQDEAVANAAITPGQLVEELSTAKVQKQATAAAVVAKAFAIEDYLQGNDIDDNYASAARVLYRVFKSGDEVYAILADGENAAIGSRLESNGSGELRVQDLTSAGAIANPEALIGFAREAVDASDSATTAVTDRRIIVRIA